MTDFVDNKYRRWYFQICDSGRGRVRGQGMERHHIVPKSLGGNNKPENLVLLTYREHFIAHWLLTKFTIGQARTKMTRALGCMVCSRAGRILTSRQFEIARRAFVQVHRGQRYALGIKHSAEAKIRHSIANRNRSPEARAKLSAHARNRSEETREKLRIAASNPSAEDRARKSAAARKRKASPETRAKISAATLGNKRCVGRVLSAETKAKIGAASRNRSPESNAKIGAAQRATAARRKAERAAGERPTV